MIKYISYDDLVEILSVAFRRLSRINPNIKRIDVNGTRTIMFYEDGRKIISNVHDEEFDAEKGIMMCIVKGRGVTHSSIRKLMKACDGHDEKGLLRYLVKNIGYDDKKIKELVKSIKYQGMKPKNVNKVREVKRLARKGEYVRTVDNYKFKEGEIVKCVKECKDDINIFSNDDEDWFLAQGRYVVLEGYEPEVEKDV